MATATGIVLAVQESRFRLLTDDGRGLLFIMAASSPIEASDLLPLAHRRVRVDYEPSPKLIAAIAQDLTVLDEQGGRP